MRNRCYDAIGKTLIFYQFTKLKYFIKILNSNPFCSQLLGMLKCCRDRSGIYCSVILYGRVPIV